MFHMANRTFLYTIKNIKKYRKQKGYTQEQLSELANISTDYLSEIERGKKKPSIDTLDSITSALEIEPYMLFVEE